MNLDCIGVGYELVKWEALEGGKVVEKETTIDLFDVWNRLNTAGAEAETAGRFAEALVKRTDWMRANGFPGISSSSVWFLYQLFIDRIVEIKKKILSPMPVEMPNSTGSQSGESGPIDPPPVS